MCNCDGEVWAPVNLGAVLLGARCVQTVQETSWYIEG